MSLVCFNPLKATHSFGSTAHHQRRLAGERFIISGGQRGLTFTPRQIEAFHRGVRGVRLPGVCQTSPTLKSTFRCRWKQEEINSTCLRLTCKALPPTAGSADSYTELHRPPRQSQTSLPQKFLLRRSSRSEAPGDTLPPKHKGESSRNPSRLQACETSPPT